MDLAACTHCEETFAQSSVGCAMRNNPLNLVARGSQPAHVGVLLKDPSNGPWGVIIEHLDHLYYILPI